MNTLPRIVVAILATGILSTAGCGGGGGGGGTPPPPPPPPTDGITGTGVAVGPITGFGSVIVNGVTYDTSSATFTKDGDPATQDNFSVGQVVVVNGTIDDDGTTGTAETVEFDDVVEGPVASVDNALNQIVVLGQTVSITATTSIDDSCPATLDGLLGVPAVEVSGLADAFGVVEATRIECKFLPDWDGIMEVTGFATNVTATTFEINALTVNYSGGVLDNDFPGGMINEGDPVEAKGDTLNGDILMALSVDYKGNRFANDDGVHAEIEGFITRFGSATDFDVSGIPVTTVTGTTVFEGGPTGTSADLNENLKVEVEGEFDANGTLVATKVEIKTATAIRVTGTLDSVSGSTLVILGITVNTDSLTTRFEDKSDSDIDPLGVGDLAPGEYVEIRGQEQPVGQITAMIVEREDMDTRTELQGFVTADTGSTLTVLGVTIETISGTTRYFDSTGATEMEIDAATFWAAVDVGSLVDARGTESGDTTLAATELELEM